MATCLNLTMKNGTYSNNKALDSCPCLSCPSSSNGECEDYEDMCECPDIEA
jgi:hypothetical protein